MIDLSLHARGVDADAPGVDPSVEVVFDVEGLRVDYRDVTALKDVNLSIPEKQITALIGPSGCGKTTLIRCFNRKIGRAHV